MALFLALLPILVILVLLIFRRTAADVAGLVGWAVILLVAGLYFQTPLPVLLLASLGGVVASFPITLMVAASILQITIMLETGAIARLVALIKTVAPTSQVAQIMIVNIGALGLLVAAASGIGGGLASVISPAKLQNAAASIDRIGEEGQVLRTTFVISLIITAVCALLTLAWSL